jgi:hypothetical protein
MPVADERPGVRLTAGAGHGLCLRLPPPCEGCPRGDEHRREDLHVADADTVILGSDPAYAVRLRGDLLPFPGPDEDPTEVDMQLTVTVMPAVDERTWRDAGVVGATPDGRSVVEPTRGREIRCASQSELGSRVERDARDPALMTSRPLDVPVCRAEILCGDTAYAVTVAYRPPPEGGEAHSAPSALQAHRVLRGLQCHSDLTALSFPLEDVDGESLGATATLHPARVPCDVEGADLASLRGTFRRAGDREWDRHGGSALMLLSDGDRGRIDWHLLAIVSDPSEPAEVGEIRGRVSGEIFGSTEEWTVLPAPFDEESSVLVHEAPLGSVRLDLYAPCEHDECTAADLSMLQGSAVVWAPELPWFWEMQAGGLWHPDSGQLGWQLTTVFAYRGPDNFALGASAGAGHVGDDLIFNLGVDVSLDLSHYWREQVRGRERVLQAVIGGRLGLRAAHSLTNEASIRPAFELTPYLEVRWHPSRYFLFPLRIEAGGSIGRSWSSHAAVTAGFGGQWE